MDHTTALRNMAVEKYLLDEFDPSEKEEYEDHFFSCDECAREIKTGAAFMAHGKQIFEREKAASSAATVVKPLPKVIKRDWFAWLRPAFAAPALAFMLGVVVFQNLVQVPALHQSLVAMNAPAVMPFADLKSGSSRGDEPVVAAKTGELFQLTLDIPDTSSTAHTAELYDSAGRKILSLAIPADAPKEGLSLKMPGDLPAGNYSLSLKQAGASESKEISRYAFLLKRT
jgi:hypothetical protein